MLLLLLGQYIFVHWKKIVFGIKKKYSFQIQNLLGWELSTICICVEGNSLVLMINT